MVAELGGEATIVGRRRLQRHAPRGPPGRAHGRRRRRTRCCRVTRYYNRPNRRGIVRHYEEVARAAGGTPVIVYNIPSRTTRQHRPRPAGRARADRRRSRRSSRPTRRPRPDRRPDGVRRQRRGPRPRARPRLRRRHLRRQPHRRHRDAADVRRARAPRGDRRVAARRLRRDVLHREPDPGQGRAEPARATTSAALRLPLVEADEHELDDRSAARSSATACLTRSPRGVSGTLRVLPLGGLGEIGKNMTVVEYDDRIVVVDCGLRFPTAEMMGIDLVLPDFTYLRERVDDIEAIVITHGHEDHLGALPWVLRELGQDSVPVVYGGQLTVAMARSKLDEHKLREVDLDVLPIGEVAEAGPFDDRAGAPHALDPRRRAASRSRTELGHGPVHRRLQVRPDAGRRRAGRHGAARRARAARGCCCCAATRRTPTGRASRPASRSSARSSSELFARCQGRIVVTCFASNIHRVQQVVDAAAALGRKVALVGRSMRKNVNIGRSLGHIDDARGAADPAARDRALPRREARDRLDRLPGRAAVRAAPDGLPRPPAGRAQARATRSSSRPRRSPATSARSTRRSTACTTSAATWSRPATRRSTPPATATPRR